MSEIDRDTAAFLAELAAAQAPPITAGTPEEARAANAQFLATVGIDPVPVRSVEEVEIPGPAGPIPARRYRDAEYPQAVLVFFHGGGWVLGNLDGHDPLCRLLAKEAGLDVVSVDYRHAPEHPFPAGLDDSFAATEWAAGLAPGMPLIVAGDSSGGNLAAAVALRARDEDGPEIDLQLLFYPVLDHDLETDSYRRFGEGHLLLRGDMAWFLDHYVPDRARRDDPYVAPLRAEDLSGVASAYLALGGHDPLFAEGAAFAERLRAAGVEVTINTYEDLIHGFLTMPKAIPSTQRAIDEVVGDVGRLAREAARRKAPETSHIGLHVADLERSLGFYRDLLGLELLDRGRREGAHVGELLGRPGAAFERALLRLPRTRAFLELIEYDEPGEPVDPLHGNVGTCHVAFYTDDLDETWAALRAAGSELQGPHVTVIEGGVFDGGKVIYCTDPDGIRVEFLEGPAYLDASRREPEALPKDARANETSHAGIHVSDLDRSLEFWVGQLGFEVVSKFVAQDAGTREVIGLPEADLNMAILRLPGTQSFFEVIEYRNSPGRRAVDPDHFNPRTCHVALHVERLQPLCKRLASDGAGLISSGVVEIPDGLLAGAKAVYCTDPDGFRVELIESDRYLDGTPMDETPA